MKDSGKTQSIQCSVCGHWMRLHGKDENGHAVQRFYPCCGESGQYEHIRPVCDTCCKKRCPYDLNIKAPGRNWGLY